MTGLPTPLSEQGDTIIGVWNIFLMIGAGVGVLILGLVAIIIIRFRRRDDGLPEQVHYKIGLEVAYTLIPLAIIIGLFALTLTSLNDVQRTTADPDLVVDVVAFQWQWEFNYDGTAVTLAQSADGEAPILVLPTDRVVEFRLESRDVIHSFWVPGFLLKRDIIPGRPGTLQVDLNGEPGIYRGVCAEFCGLDHTSMRFQVELMTPADFDTWLNQQQANS